MASADCATNGGAAAGLARCGFGYERLKHGVFLNFCLAERLQVEPDRRVHIG